MKTIEERAKEYVKRVYDGNYTDVELGFIRGAQSEHEELTRWNSPECEPKINTPILLKMESPRKDIIYRTGFFICGYVPYDDDVYRYKVVGWREI